MADFENMTLEEFRVYVIKNDSNIVNLWDRSRFPVSCGKCMGTSVWIVRDLDYDAGHGCETCGYEAYLDGRGILVKCSDCGSAMMVVSKEQVGG